MARFMGGLATTGSQTLHDDQTLLTAAKRNLEKCAFIGLMEEYEQSMTVLRKTFPTGIFSLT